MPSRTLTTIRLTLILLITLALPCVAASTAVENSPPAEALDNKAQETVDALEEPLYNPFVERYVLDELKRLRMDLAEQKNEMIQKIVDREYSAVDRAVRYSTDTVTYFFYLIAGASSVLVLIGWTSIRDIKERVHHYADEQVSKLVESYEQQLQTLEAQLNAKSEHIDRNREEIELTQQLQGLWLKAGQESNPVNKITLYDEILSLRNDDLDAITYKADAVLEMGEPQWAISLCRQALKIEKNYPHALYQMACACTTLGQFDDALDYLLAAIEGKETYREDAVNDDALTALFDDTASRQRLIQLGINTARDVEETPAARNTGYAAATG